MTRDHIKMILRVLAFGVALAMWGLSVVFSIDGFGIEMPNMVYIGIVMALCVTAIELIANQRDANLGLTITIVGLAAYTYGTWTNVLGITEARGIVFADAGWKQLVFPIAWAVVLEFAPERFIVWALTEDTYGDFLENVLGKVSRRRSPMPMMNRPMMPPPGMNRPPLPMRPNGNGRRMPTGHPFEK